MSTQPSPQALRFSRRRGKRETRVTGDEPQGTMGRVQRAGETTSRSLSPSRLPLRAHFHRERERRLGARQVSTILFVSHCSCRSERGAHLTRRFPSSGDCSPLHGKLTKLIKIHPFGIKASIQVNFSFILARRNDKYEKTHRVRLRHLLFIKNKLYVKNFQF